MVEAESAETDLHSLQEIREEVAIADAVAPGRGLPQSTSRLEAPVENPYDAWCCLSMNSIWIS